MGSLKEFSCKCGYKEELNIGSGMAAVNTRMIEKIFPKAFKKALSEKEEGNVLGMYMENVIIECSTCEKLFTVPQLVIEKNDGSNDFYFNSICETCGTSGKKNEEENIKCPVCGLDMSVIDIGNWD